MAVYKTEHGWRADFSFKDASGKYRKKSKRGFKTKKEAESWLAEYSINHGKPTLQKGSQILFTDYFDEYAKLRLETGMKEATHESWRFEKKFVVDVYFTGLTLDQITRQMYQSFLNHYAIGKKRQTVSKRHRLLRLVINQAFHDGLIQNDPTFGVTIPGSDSKDASEKFLQLDELTTLIEYIENDDKLITWRTGFMVYLISLSGLRAGEALALTKNDIDSDARTITVSKTKQLSGAVTTPKTKTSNRTLVMPNRFFDSYQKFIGAKENWNAANELFDGRRTPSVVNRWLERLEKSLGFENIVSLHGLRHSHVSYLLSSGVDISYASKRLGHSNVSITQDTYAHLLQHKQQSEENKTIALLDQLN